MVFKSNRIFPSLVIEKLTARFIIALQKDEVQTAKLLLRSMAALASSNCVILSGENSFFSIIEALNDVTESSWVRRKEGSSEKAVLDHQGQVTAYLVATALPWVLTSFNEPSVLPSAEMDKAKIVLKKAVDSCERVCAEWSSPFEVGGQQAVFHVGIIHTTDSAAANADDMKGRYSYEIADYSSNCFDTDSDRLVSCPVEIEIMLCFFFFDHITLFRITFMCNILNCCFLFKISPPLLFSLLFSSFLFPMFEYL